MTTTHETLTAILIDQLGVEASQVTPEARLIDDLGCDSLNIVEMTMTIEDEFKIEIPDDEAEAFQNATIADVLALIDKKRVAA